MDREALIDDIRRCLDGRHLVYFGTRGEDAEGVADLPELSAVFSVIAPYRRRTGVQSLALEELSGTRVDLDAHDIDDHLHDPAVVELRRAMLRALADESVVFTYRPSAFLAAVCFARADRCTYAGLFKDHQVAFEHKPWVETELRRLGVRGIPWTYVADEEQLRALDLLVDGPVVLRSSRSSGGTGLVRLQRASDLVALWPHQTDTYASVAPYFEDGVPTNVSAVVWDEGVTLHQPSVQLIGIPECTSRPFGYCGNDFGAMAALSETSLREMEATTIRLGDWLRERGFRGAYGVDFLVLGDEALFTEVNPRLQGVTHLSCKLSVGRGESCVMLEHLAAFLRCRAPRSPSLPELVERAPSLGHVVLHSGATTPTSVDGDAIANELTVHEEVAAVDVICAPTTSVDPNGTVARATVNGRLTADGRTLLPSWRARIAKATWSTELPES